MREIGGLLKGVTVAWPELMRLGRKHLRYKCVSRGEHSLLDVWDRAVICLKLILHRGCSISWYRVSQHKAQGFVSIEAP